MGWYIKRSTKITQLDCLEDGPAKYHVEYTIRNTMTDEESKTLPHYITGNPSCADSRCSLHRALLHVGHIGLLRSRWRLVHTKLALGIR